MIAGCVVDAAAEWKGRSVGAKQLSDFLLKYLPSKVSLHEIFLYGRSEFVDFTFE